MELGRFGPEAEAGAVDLRTGVPLGWLAKSGRANREVNDLVRQLAQLGFVEYRLGRAGENADIVAIEPQTRDYWPRLPKLAATDTLALSRFAYLRRRGDALVLESPRAKALFRIGDQAVAAALVTLARPQKLGRLRQSDGFPGDALIALLIDCDILFKVAPETEGLRWDEGDSDLILFDFHDLLFHARSAEGRHANPFGGAYPHVDVIAPLPSARPAWPGPAIDLAKFEAQPSPVAALFRERHSVREFDAQAPITLAELAQFLDGTARVLSHWQSPIDEDGGGPVVDFTGRPYPSAGSAYPLELYLAVGHCADLPRGFYHYDADAHALTRIPAKDEPLQAMLHAAEFAMDAPGPPQVLITIAARFGRTSWKYTSIAYSLILKDVGALLQTFYLMAANMALGGCAIGTHNIDLFEQMTRLAFYAEGPVGQFALGRPAKPSEGRAG
ncbi:MAG: SagB family peptide dehydrogenase [Bradyrhizobium sp.]|nr:SagB family peptide dehydrogenase [Bradyrhizobium sp.]